MCVFSTLLGISSAWTRYQGNVKEEETGFWLALTTVKEVLITQENITDYLGSSVFFFYLVNGNKIYDWCKELPHIEINDMWKNWERILIWAMHNILSEFYLNIFKNTSKTAKSIVIRSHYFRDLTSGCCKNTGRGCNSTWTKYLK